MKTITRLGTIVAAFTLLSTLALAAPKTERAQKYFKVRGTVVQIDNKDRTLLVEDRRANKLYLIGIPEGVTFKITFGRYMQLAEPGFEDVRSGERVEIRCIRSDADRLAGLENGPSAVPLTATR